MLSEAPASAPLAYVMGPSGAGKDSVLGCARGLLPPGSPVVFAHRYITRPADAGGENHVALSDAEFALRRARGLFAFAWSAHGNDYAVGCEIEAWRRAGMVVVVSGSRAHFAAMTGADPGLCPVLITASRERLALRLGVRGRETDEAAAARLARADGFAVDHPQLVTIVNEGAVEDAASALVRVLTRLACSRGDRPPARTVPAR